MSTHESTDRNAHPPTLGRHGDFDVYPMPAFLTLESDDVPATVRFWTEGLGFSIMYTGPEVGGVPMITHLRRGRYQDVLVTPRRPGADGAPELVPTFAHPDLDVLSASVAAIEALPGRAAAGEPEATPWGVRNLRATDPSGHTVVFTEPPAEPPTGTIDEAMETARNRIHDNNRIHDKE